MLRSFLPAALVLLLAPSSALAGADAGDTVAPVVGVPAARGASPETAERSASKRSSGKRGASKSDRRGGGSGGGSGSGDSGGSRDSSGGDSGGSRDSGERGEGGEPRASRGGGGEPPSPTSSGGRPAEGRGDGSAERGSASGEPSPADGPAARPYGGASSGGAEARERTIRSRPDIGALRPTEARSPVRSDAAPTVRKVSVGAPGAAASLGPVEPGAAARSASPSNFRGTSNLRGAPNSALAAASRARPDGGAASAERHGGGSDAVRATAGRHAARHHEAARHARATAAAHRAAAHHRAAAARHHAWVSAHRPYRWYHPRGWFSPWRPGYGYWYHGVFVYGPYPWYHHHHHHTTVVVDGGGEHGGAGDEGRGGDDAANLPERKVDRARTFAVGLRGGSYMGGYDFSGGGFGDAGLGLAARYRPVEALGLEVSWMHHDQTWDEGSERVHQPLQASVQLFAAPWTRVNPYVLAGVTVASRSVEDDVGFTTVRQTSTLWGPHAGLGIEFGVGKQTSLNFDARYTGYLNTPSDDLTFPGAFQGNMGVNFYF